MKHEYIKSYDGKKVWFTSDLHHSHTNIIKFCNRPFKEVSEMNCKMVEIWNKTIPYDGTVFVLGDISFDKNPEDIVKWVRSLNGRKHLIMGNHDIHFPVEFWLQSFETVHQLLDIKVDKQHLTLCHFPMRSWNKSHRGSWQLYGHLHGAGVKPIDQYQMDVGVDTNNMVPYHWSEICAEMASKTVNLVSHHA